MNEAAPSDEPVGDSPVVTVVRWGSIFLLIVAAVMLPILAGTVDPSARVLVIVLGMTAAFFWALMMIFRGRVVLPWGWLAGAGVAALGAAIVSALFSNCPQAALLTLLTWLGYAAAFALAFWGGTSPRIRRQVLRALCALALPIAAYGILQYTTLLDLTRDQIEADPAAVLRMTGMSQRDYPAMLQRTISKRVYSTFALPNTLAGFLLVLIPPSVALAVSARRLLTRCALGGSVIVMFVALFLTFSKGGWLVGGLVALLFIFTKGRHWLVRRWLPVTLGLAAAAATLAATAALSPTLRQRMGDMLREPAGSARVRVQYWSAGLSMWMSSPAVGVGPGNFKNHYTRHMVLGAEEVQHAHNDYVELLAECGPAALVGYLVFWLLLVLGAFAHRTQTNEKADVEGVRLSGQANTFDTRSGGSVTPLPRGVIPVAAVAGIVGAALLGQPLRVLDDALVHLEVVCVFAALWWLAYRASSDLPDRPETGAALAASLPFGMLGFLLHSVVDFDLHVEGVGLTVFIVAGLAAAPWARRRIVVLNRSLQLVAMLGLGLVAIGLVYGAKRLSEGDAYRSYGQRVLRQDLTHTQHIEARDALETACRTNPLDHRAFATLADYHRAAYLRTGDSADIERAVEAWKRAIALNPSHAQYHASLGRFLGDKARSRPVILRNYVKEYEKQFAGLPLPRPPRDAFIPALVELHRATEQAPNTPQYRTLYGNVLMRARLVDEARQQFRIALDLHEKMVERGAPRRQWLTAGEVETLKKRLRLTEAGGGARMTK